MSIKYVLTERSNPVNRDVERKWYATSKSTGEVTLKTLGNDISRRCTVNQADTLAVLEALTQVLTERLSEGNIVRFGDFGSFRITLGSYGSETEDKFNSTLIKTTKVRFSPGIDLKEMLNNLKFEKM